MISSLKAVLNTSPLKDKDNALYQVVLGIISAIGELENSVAAAKQSIIDITPTFGPSWLPKDSSGAALALTFTDAIFLEIGNIIIASASITWPATASGANATIGGLPFLSLATSVSIYPAIVVQNNSTLNFTGKVITNTDQIQFVLNTGAAVTNVQLSTFMVRFTAIYVKAQ